MSEFEFNAEKALAQLGITYGGPYDGGRTAAACDLIAELTRYLGHATVTTRDRASAVPDPQTADRAARSLGSAADRLSDVVPRFGEALEALSDNGQLGADGDRDADMEVSAACARLTVAAERLNSAGAHLTIAANNASRLYMVETGEPESAATDAP